MRREVRDLLEEPLDIRLPDHILERKPVDALPKAAKQLSTNVLRPSTTANTLSTGTSSCSTTQLTERTSQSRTVHRLSTALHRLSTTRARLIRAGL